MELIPFQTKRKITNSGIIRTARSFSFLENHISLVKEILESKETDESTVLQAARLSLFIDILSYIRKAFPKTWATLKTDLTADLYFSETKKSIFTVLQDKKTLYTTFFDVDNASCATVVTDSSVVLAKLLSPALFAQIPGNDIPLWVLDSSVITLDALHFCMDESEQPKKLVSLLPASYRTYLKRLLLSEETMLKLSEFLKSRKKAKKYLRILMKRLGIITQKKPPFKRIDKKNQVQT